MENFDAEQPMEDLQEQTPKKEPKNPLYDCYSLLHDLVYILAAITIVFVFFVRLVGVDGPSMMPTLQDGDYVALLILGQGPDDSTADEAKLAQDEAAKVDDAWKDIFGSAGNKINAQ